MTEQRKEIKEKMYSIYSEFNYANIDLDDGENREKQLLQELRYYGDEEKADIISKFVEYVRLEAQESILWEVAL